MSFTSSGHRCRFELGVLVAAAALLALSSPARAELAVIENADGQQGLTVFKMTVTPAPEPDPAFKHRLLPAASELRPGNAAQHYARAFAESMLSSTWKSVEKEFGADEVQGTGEKDAWYSVTRPLRELPMESVRQASMHFDTLINQCVARATVREDCDWGRNIEELQGLDVISLLLPEVQETRSLSRALMLRTRVAIADRDFERAIDHLKMNYQLAYNVARDPILVCGLVGIAEAALGNMELLEFIAADGSPNMYWALAEMQRPFIDVRPAIRFEMSWSKRIFPVLNEPEKQEHSPEEWARLLAKSLADMQAAAGNGQQFHEWVIRAGVSSFGVMAYPDAKRRLIAAGMSPADVERMPTGQVIAVDASREYTRIADQFEKWWYTSYHDARPHTADLDAILDDQFNGGYGRILARLLMPALNKVRDAQARLDWQMNAIQTVEAIRMHAAETGKLPASLDEIKVVPVPTNPVTGKSFQYRLDGDAAVLELPLSDGIPNVAWRFEIKLAK